jgi:ATP-binding cassette subfamily F protein 2
VLQFQSITFAYPECEPLYENVDFGVDLDSRIALVGPNGAGKSTLLKLMTGALVPTIGNVRPHSHLRLSMFTQHFIDILDLTMTPLDYMLQEYPNKTREDMRKFLGRFGASGGIQTQIMGHLSDGQKSRVVFAKIAMETPHLLLLDEPTNHLDMESIDSLAEAINHFEGGMMLVSHDMRLISQVAKEIWICDNKTITRYNGDIDDFKMHLRKEMPKPS